MYYIYGSVRAIPTYRVYRLYDYGAADKRIFGTPIHALSHALNYFFGAVIRIFTVHARAYEVYTQKPYYNSRGRTETSRRFITRNYLCFKERIKRSRPCLRLDCGHYKPRCDGGSHSYACNYRITRRPIANHTLPYPSEHANIDYVWC